MLPEKEHNSIVVREHVHNSASYITLVLEIILIGTNRT